MKIRIKFLLQSPFEMDWNTKLDFPFRAKISYIKILEFFFFSNVYHTTLHFKKLQRNYSTTQRDLWEITKILYEQIVNSIIVIVIR